MYLLPFDSAVRVAANISINHYQHNHNLKNKVISNFNHHIVVYLELIILQELFIYIHLF